LSDSCTELFEEADDCGDDKDEIVEENDDEISQPLDGAVLAEEVEVRNSCKDI
jgi:hypothetical protein